MTTVAQTFHSYTFTATTTSPGFDDDQIMSICNWAKHISDSCCIIEEMSSHRHLHGVFRVTCKQTNQVSQRFQTLYKKMDMPWIPNISVDVKRTTELIGWFHYMLKDQKAPPLVLTGWKRTWITEQCQKHVKKIPKKMHRLDRLVLDASTVVGTVLAYMSAHSLPIMDKFSFIAVVTQMQKDKFNFMKVRKALVYEAVMAELGHLDVAASAWESDLQFLP